MAEPEFAAALEAIAASADRSDALQTLTEEFARAAGASSALLSVGGWSGVPTGGTWIFKEGAEADRTQALDELIARLRERTGSPLEPSGDVLWRSQAERGSTCDFIGVRVRVGGLPIAGLCAALKEPASPPDPLVEVARRFAGLASLCLVGGDLGGRFRSSARHPLAISLDESEIRAALASEISRCGLSGEPLTVCIVNISDLPDLAAESGERVAERLFAVLGQAVAEAAQPYDFVGRVSHSELLVVVPGADGEEAVATARNLRRVARLALGATSEHEVRTGFKIAEWDRSEDGDELLARARSHGRNGRSNGGPSGGPWSLIG